MSDQFHRLFAQRFIVILRRKDDGTIISDFCVMLLLHVKQYAGKSSSNFQNTPQIFTVYNTLTSGFNRTIPFCSIYALWINARSKNFLAKTSSISHVNSECVCIISKVAHLNCFNNKRQIIHVSYFLPLSSSLYNTILLLFVSG